ncbi:MAG TPA: phosphotransferase [Candidatus Binatia bacterium]|nr:phosphotransferase [Candidatus Binatia bacterium]
MALALDTLRLADYLTGVLGEPVEVVGLRSLGGEAIEDPKGFGYGVPFEVECRLASGPRSLVVSRTRPASGFGHDYPADRAWQALYGHAAYNDFPRHARSLDVGFVRTDGEMVSAADAVDFFQLVEKVEGRLYWLDLQRLMQASPTPLDTERARALAGFLATVHADKRDEPALYARRVRELVGHGECVMGILDSLPHPWPPLRPELCEALETAFVRWRWRLRERAGRLSRTHGDFHPWNILFREGTDFGVLDRSRGEWGEPADDVAALGINYLFFGMRRAAARGERGVAEPFLTLFHTFLATYVERSHDRELFDTLPPFLAFRALVLAHPRWYPDLAPTVRDGLIHLATRLAASARFEPGDVAWLCGAVR